MSAGVYWRRRAMVLGTAVLLVVAGVDLVDGDDSGPSDTAQQVVGTPTSPPAAGPSQTPSQSQTTRKKRKKKQDQTQPVEPVEPVEPVYTPPPPPAEPEGACADDDIVIAPVMGPVLAGRPVLVTLELRTEEAEACTWTISREHLAYRIVDADGDDVWSSAECPAQVPEDRIVVRRELTATYRLAWNGRRSSRDCPASMGAVPPGDYAVQAAAIGGEPSVVVPFTLSDPADVVAPEPIGPPVPETTKPDRPEDKGKEKDKSKGKNKGKPTNGPTRPAGQT